MPRQSMAKPVMSLATKGGFAEIVQLLKAPPLPDK